MTALRNRDFALLWQAQAVSQTGNHAFAIASSFWMMQATGSATMTAVVLAVGVLPGVVLGPFAGAFVDRSGARLTTVVACDAICGVAMLVLAGAFAVAPPDWRAALIVAAALIVGLCAALFEPALQSLVPDIVPPERVMQANALTASSRQVIGLAAKILGGVLYALVGPAALLLLNGLSFLFAAGTERLIRVPPAASAPRAAAPARHLFAGARDGWRYLHSHRKLASILWTTAVFNAMLMPVTALLPAYSTLHLGGDVRWYGFLLSAITAGALCASLVLSARPDAGENTTALTVALVLMGALVIALGQVRELVPALAIMFLTGICTTVVNVCVVSILQCWPTPDFRARVYALHVTLSRALIPVSLVAGGVAADLAGRDIPLVYGLCGGFALLTVICATVCSRWNPRPASAPPAGASSCLPASAVPLSSTTS